jgi:hypothetical protein
MGTYVDFLSSNQSDIWFESVLLWLYWICSVSPSSCCGNTLHKGIDHRKSLQRTVKRKKNRRNKNKNYLKQSNKSTKLNRRKDDFNVHLNSQNFLFVLTYIVSKWSIEEKCQKRWTCFYLHYASWSWKFIWVKVGRVKILTNEINKWATGQLPPRLLFTSMAWCLCIRTSLPSFYAQAHLFVCFCVSERGNIMDCEFKLKSQHKLPSL